MIRTCHLLMLSVVGGCLLAAGNGARAQCFQPGMLCDALQGQVPTYGQPPSYAPPMYQPAYPQAPAYQPTYQPPPAVVVSPYGTPMGLAVQGGSMGVLVSPDGQPIGAFQPGQ